LLHHRCCWMCQWERQLRIYRQPVAAAAAATDKLRLRRARVLPVCSQTQQCGELAIAASTSSYRSTLNRSALCNAVSSNTHQQPRQHIFAESPSAVQACPAATAGHSALQSMQQ
jgi:hypothetical protein